MRDPSDEEYVSVSEEIDTVDHSQSHSIAEEKNAEDTLSQSSLSKASYQTLISDHQASSSLTIENVKQYEEQTDRMNVEELMSKTHDEASYKEKDSLEDDVFADEYNLKTEENQPFIVPSTIQQQENNYAYSPTERIVTRGSKITGEPYEAITIDVQTDYSWLRESYFMQQADKTTGSPLHTLSHSRTSRAESCENARSGSQSIIDDASLIKQIIQRRHTSSLLSSSSSSSTHGSDTARTPDDENPVIEVNLSAMDYHRLGGESDQSVRTNSTASVHPPYILQYKPESKAPVIDYNNIEVQDRIPSDLDWDDLSAEEQEHYSAILQELRYKRKSQEQEFAASHRLIDIEPHAAYGSQKVGQVFDMEKKVAKERAAEKMRAREAEKQKQANPAANQANFYAFARQLKTVNYSLSSLKCMEEGWTILPVSPPTPIDVPRDSFIPESETNIMSAKRYHHTFLQKFYENGKIFLALFTDGTGSVWYPSGNLAVSMVATERIGKLIYIIHEDRDIDESPNIQAVFEPDGNCTCYYSSGIIRVNLTPLGGEYYSSVGERMKKWHWRSADVHVHAPPFQPITFGLSKQIGIRIISQDHIHVTFSDGKRNVRFNVGTRIRLKNSLMRRVVELDADKLYLEERVVFLQTLIEKIHCSSKFSHSPRRDLIKLPNYLDEKSKRTSKARASLIARLPPIGSNMSLNSGGLVPGVSASARLFKEKQRFRRSKLKRKPHEQAKSMPVEEIKFSVTVN